MLADSESARDYWFKMKLCVKFEDGAELSTYCRQLKLPAADGKERLIDAVDPALSGVTKRMPWVQATSMLILLCYNGKTLAVGQTVQPATKRHLDQEMLK